MIENPHQTALRHDAHKMRGQSHQAAPATMYGVPVNQDVPNGSDSDAAAMSRPNGKPQPALPGHETHYRRSLITGRTEYDETEFNLQTYATELETLLATEDAAAMHRAWLDHRVTAWFNESTYRPYTSLKYHTLLVNALTHHYEQGREYADLALEIHAHTRQGHHTIFTDPADEFALSIVENHHGAGKLSTYPQQNFASVWQRLPGGVLDSHDRQWQVIDATLRRLQSWSTALQYLENVRIGGVA